MDIMELGAIGEPVGGVAVLATLIYLAVQVRQNNEQAFRQNAIALNDSAQAGRRELTSMFVASVDRGCKRPRRSSARRRRIP